MITDIINRILCFLARNVKKALVALTCTLLIGGVCYLAYTYTYHFIRDDAFETYDVNGEEISIDIPEGSTTGEIADILYENGLIENTLLFRIKAKLTGAENEFQYGVYKVIKGMPETKIMEILKEGSKEEAVMITIPEGWSVRQIGEYLEDKNICLASEFEAACNRTDYDFDYYGVIDNQDERQYLLEGYLFPETYEVIPMNGAEGVVKRLLREFELRWERNPSWRSRADELGLTVDEVMTMASAVEMEAMLSEERPKVARVLYNRLQEGMTWGLNCTVLYALGKEGTGDDYVSYTDLEIKSGYNTYANTGFPVGPICNPSESSINAVLHAEEGDWLYFIGFEDGSGEHLFTNDYAEFQAVEAGTYVRGEEGTGETDGYVEESSEE